MRFFGIELDLLDPAESFPVDEDTHANIKAKAKDLSELPVEQEDGSFTTGVFFGFGDCLNRAASDDVRGNAIARYNGFVAKEDRIEDPMSQTANVRYPVLMYECLADEIVLLAQQRDSIDPKLGAAMRFFGIDLEELDLFAEKVWVGIRDTGAENDRVERRMKKLFDGTDVAKYLEDYEFADPVLDGTVRVEDFHAFMDALNTATKSDVREVAIDKYNALVSEKHRIVDPAANMQTRVVYPAILYACLEEACEELAHERG